MKIVLLKTVSKLGKAGDIKEVSDGYARNYLLPNQLAAPSRDRVSDEGLSNHSKERRGGRDESLAMKRLKQTIGGKNFKISARANQQGTLFAGVTAGAISAILHGEGYNIEPAMIDLSPALKRAGDHEIAINFGREGRAVIILSIIPLGN